MKKTFAIVFLVFSAVIYSAPPIIVDQSTGEYLVNLGAQNSINNPALHKVEYKRDSMNSRNNPMAHHGNNYVQDSMNKRNNPVRYDRVIVNPFVGHKRVYLQDSMNKRNNPGGKYYVPQEVNNPASSNVTEPHLTPVMIQVKEW